jgi:hypothetical protein
MAAPVTVPAGFVEVPHEEFFRLLYADPRDIMPSIREPTCTTWETKERVVWGWSYPGWRNPGEPGVYAVHDTVQRSPNG